ncbi:MAG: TIGR04348 family glycosyltransferase [Methylibium sp.]|uniref:selenoneine biosynthesis selenosugar synthase SenB n=1 Tax=Methylibium sp. TaxID=2067992 RepID=UPI00180EB12C|nr:selenoneine biosynthesis selenosugar synthase SenB [Methylibium sp.]MBA3598788.1 TIGR04348 family glycosyltransferase [Methylibium sp.]
MGKPRVCIVSPAAAGANNGNWHTALRWQRFLAPLAEVCIVQRWDGAPADALIALHARRSAESIECFAERHPQRPLALVLTGTDLYRDLASEAVAQHSVECASHLVVLQDEGLHRLAPGAQAKARVIVQSAPRLIRHDRACRRFDLVAVGHLREEKDPLTLMRAVRLLPAETNVRIHHIGNALDADLKAAAERCAAECAAYRWLGGLAHAATRRWIARSRGLVHMSRMEGGANVVIEALRSRVPVLASRIDGNVGLLGSDYDGYFPLGDAQALSALMQRFASDAEFAAHLQVQCSALEPRFAPAVESAAVRTLLRELLLHGSAHAPAGLLTQ